MNSKPILTCLLGALLAGMPETRAAIGATNGDFETGAGNSIDNVTDWFDNSDDTYWHGTWQTNNAGISPNDTCVVVLGSYEAGGVQGGVSASPSGGNWLYQSIGTADGGEAQIQVDFQFGQPDDDPGGRTLGVTVSVYAYNGTGTFAAGDNTDLQAASLDSATTGVTLLDSESFQFGPTTAANQALASLSSTLDIAGAGSQTLFLRFNNYRPAATESWPVIDNVTVVSVAATPVFSVQPLPYNGNVGDTVTLTASAASDPAPTFQWEYSPDGLDPWTPIDGATSATYEIVSAPYSANGYYRVVADNGTSATSDETLVELVYPVPAIIQQPASTAVEVGSGATFTVVAYGYGTLTYQWFKDDVAIEGAISDFLELTNVQLSDAGQYAVQITDDAALADGQPATTTLSDTATLGVYAPWSGLVSHDPFDIVAGYVAGELPAQNPTIAGYAGAWTDIDFGDAEPAIAAGSLSYGDPLYLGSSGDKVTVATDTTDGEIVIPNSGRVCRVLDAPLTVNDFTSGVRYLSFLFQSGQETGATTYQTLALNSANGDANRNFDIGLTNNDGQTGTAYNFGTDNSYTSTGVAADTNVHLLVVKFDLSATAASDNVTVWVDPALGSGEPAGGVTVSGTDLNWDRLVISDYDGNSAAWDEIRWGSTFDSVTLNTTPANTFASWIAGYPGVGAFTGFNDDADGDGIDNGVENLFGTNPGVSNQGIVQVAKSGSTVTFQHPQNATPASDVSAAYVWSTDLATFNADGAESGGATVSFAASPNTPVAGTTTVSATITGTVPAKLFVALKAMHGAP